MSLLVAAASMLGLVPVLSPTGDLRAAELKVLAGGSLRSVLTELGPQFERASGHKLDIHFDTTPNLIKLATSGDPFGFRVELYASMEKRPNLLRRYDLYRGCHPQRLDHLNVFAAEVQKTLDFYARLGFRLTEYAEEDGPQGRIAAAWLHRKGNVHDFALTNGKGPRLHHFAYWVPGAMNILHLCDVMASSGYLKNIERGPGRHGISNALFLYVRDPDGHRLELYTSDYFTGDHDHAPMRWSLKDPRRQTLWGAPAPRSWFEQGSPFFGQAVREPQFVADVTVTD